MKPVRKDFQPLPETIDLFGRLPKEIIDAKWDAKRALLKIKIDAPDGKREIALDEAEELAEFIRKSALDLIKGSNKYKK